MDFFSLVSQMLKFISLGGSRRWLKLISCLLVHYQWLFRGSLLDLFLFSSSDLGGNIWWLPFKTIDYHIYVEGHYQLPGFLREENQDYHIIILSWWRCLIQVKHVSWINDPQESWSVSRQHPLSSFLPQKLVSEITSNILSF